MCTRSSIFPLVRLKNGKRKVLFNLDYKVKNIDDYNHIKYFIDTLKFNIKTKKSDYYVPGYQYMKRVMKTEGVEELEDIISVPCGKCEDCLKANARSWAIRILQEAKQYEHNYFITLTYDDAFLPPNGSLVKDEISKFNKKLKTYLSRSGLNSQFRFYAVAEYGEKFWRPHYHIIYFNLDLPDLKFHHTSKEGFPCYTSKFLDSVWSREIEVNGEKKSVPIGFVDVQDVSVGSACYVARYCDKKKKNLTREDLDLMKKFNLEPEFSRMSRMPGIGANYMNEILEKVKNGSYKIHYKDNDFSIPKFYSRKFDDLLDKDVLESMKSYNNMIADNFTYKNIMSSVDLEEKKLYNDFVVSQLKKKRGF